MTAVQPVTASAQSRQVGQGDSRKTRLLAEVAIMSLSYIVVQTTDGLHVTQDIAESCSLIW